MEGYVQKKTDRGVFPMRRFLRKYLIVDFKDEVLMIFPQKPPSDDEKSEEPEAKTQVELIVDFAMILEVTWKRERKGGRRFNVVFKSRSRPKHRSNSTKSLYGELLREDEHVVIIKILANSQAATGEWVRTIAKGIAMARAKRSRDVVEKRQIIFDGQGRSRSDSRNPPRPESVLTKCPPLRKANSHSNPTTPKNNRHLSPRTSGSESNGIRRSSSPTSIPSLIRTRKAPKPVNVSEKSVEDEVVGTPRKRSLKASMVISQDVAPEPSAKRNISVTISKDLVSEESERIVTEDCKASDEQSDLHSDDNLPEKKLPKAEQIVITPFKEAIWDLIACYYKLSEKTEERKFPTLEEKTMELLETYSKMLKGEKDDHDVELTLNGNSTLHSNIIYNYDSEIVHDDEEELSDSDASTTPLKKIELFVTENEEDVDNSQGEATVAFKRLMFAKDFSEVSQKLKNNVQRTSAHYNHMEYNDLVKGVDIIRWLLNKCEKFPNLSEQDAAIFANELIRKDLITPFPFVLKKSVVKFRKDNFYSFQLSEEERIVSAFRQSVYVDNFDFWTLELWRKTYNTKKQARVTRGLHIYKDCILGKVLTDWLVEALTKEKKLAIIFLEILMKKHVLIDVTDESCLNFSEESLYRFKMDNIRRGIIDGESTFQTYLQKVLNEEFLFFFCRMADDAAVLGSVLSMDSLNAAEESKVPSNSASLPEEAVGGSNKIATPKLTLRKILHELLVERSTTTRTKLHRVFELDDQVAHGLAVDLYWELLKRDEFRNHVCANSLNCDACTKAINSVHHFCETFLCKKRFMHEYLKGSLIAALVDEVWSPVKPAPLNQNVLKPGLWKTYFLWLRKAEPSLMESGLRDAFSLVLDNSDNVRDIVQQPCWFDWILDYCILGEEFAESEILAKNIISQCLYHSFTRSTNFIPIALSIIRAMENRSFEYCFVCFEVFRNLLSKIVNSKVGFGLNMSTEEISYQNLAKLAKLVANLAFAFADWGARPAIDLEASMFVNDYSEQFIREPGVPLDGYSRSFIFDLVIPLLELMLQTFKILHINYEDISINPQVDAAEKQFVFIMDPYRELFQAGVKMYNSMESRQTSGKLLTTVNLVVKKFIARGKGKRAKFVEEDFNDLFEASGF